MRTLRIRPLTGAAFAEFGDVIETEGAQSFLINEGTTRRYNALTELDISDQSGRAILSVFEAERRAFPFQIKMMERHPLGSQAFFPLDNWTWLAVVARGEVPTPESCEAFVATGRQGVQYAKGVWHHPLIAIEDGHQFLVADRIGDGENLEEVFFEKSALLNAPG